MCCCGKPTMNGEDGYRWNQPDGPTMVHPAYPPTLEEGDEMLFDEAGRCGNGTDSHSYHYRLVRNYRGGFWLLVQHGGGAERFYLGRAFELADILATLESNTRYWILNRMYHSLADIQRAATNKETVRWEHAAAEKRIKTRRYPSRGTVKVWIEERAR